jgi:hypothetical protein
MPLVSFMFPCSEGPPIPALDDLICTRSYSFPSVADVNQSGLCQENLGEGKRNEGSCAWISTKNLWLAKPLSRNGFILYRGRSI